MSSEKINTTVSDDTSVSIFSTSHEAEQNIKPITQKNYKGITAIFLLLVSGGFLAYSTLESEGTLSKFTSTTITSKNAASLWQPSNDNPNRGKLSNTYAPRLDILTTAILKKGGNMSDEQFISYLSNLYSGISNLGKKPNYSSNQEILDILGYLAYEINATVVTLGGTSPAGEQVLASTGTGASNGSGSTAVARSFSGSTTATGTILTAEQKKEQEKEHNSYLSLHSINQLRFIENEILYARHVNSPDVFTYQNYLDSREPVVVSGFKNYFNPEDPKNCVIFPHTGKTCFSGGQPSNKVDSGYYTLQFSEMTFGKETTTENAPAARQFLGLNQNFSGNQDPLGKFRVYLPKGTVAVNIISYVPQWTRYAVAAKIGSAPNSDRPLNALEYINNFSKISNETYKTDHERLMSGEEVVVTSNGGGVFSYPGHELLSLYEKLPSEYTAQQLQNRDAFESKEGKWLYISQLEGNIGNVTIFVTVKSDVYRSEYSKLEWDSKGDPVFKGFSTSASGAADPYVGGNPTATDYVTAVEQIGEMQKWVLDANLNPHTSPEVLNSIAEQSNTLSSSLSSTTITQ